MTYRIIDDFFKPDVLKTIQIEVFSPMFDWKALPGIAGNANNSGLADYGFAAAFEPRSNFITTYIEGAVKSTLATIGDLMRIRFGLRTYCGGESLSEPHVDFAEAHQTLLVYLNDSDGDTVFYDSYYHPQRDELIRRSGSLKQYKRVTPKVNRAVLFHGFQYHSSSAPLTNQMRYVLNINFKTDV